ncbi:50S ribosomal protein L24 [Candidatus Woesebacteria bacterium]|nr:50S ribosomal protein L24 [Candidatus Woesebacteria bacterium]
MKLKLGDTVKLTGGKDKGKTGVVRLLLPKEDRVVVEGLNMYVRHIKPTAGRSGEKVRAERPLPTANVAIINDKGKTDRIAYKVSKDGSKTRVFAKTGSVIPDQAPKPEKKK